MIKDEQQWKATVREVSLLSQSPIQQSDGKWKVGERLAAWKALGSRIFDEHLDRIEKVAIKVLRERDPQFDLEPDQRFAASLHGKVLEHSHSLRNGLAETLALLGNYSEYLTSCSKGRAEGTARSAVRAILENADWELWGSLNDVLPLLAEAAPKEFLEAVENALNSDPSPFDRVFAEEGSGFTGRNYMTGLIWALETLAWDDEYLTQVVMILGELAARDPGGNWGNRPANSLWTILLPWFPQTLAQPAKRQAAVATLQTEYPDVAWKLLLNLLPQTHQSSLMTRKPTWRKTIPESWSEGATNQEYREQLTGYAELAIATAKQDRAKLATLVGHLVKLPPPAREQILSYVGSQEVASLPQQERLPIWNKLVGLVSRHRKFADAGWAMPPDEVNQIAAVAERLEPELPEYKYRRLFVLRDFDLYEEKGNFEQQRMDLEVRRQRAVEEVYSKAGSHAIIGFAETVESPWRVGLAFGALASAGDDAEILPKLLESESKWLAEFAVNFLLGRFRRQGWQWVDTINITQWTTKQKALFLAYLPFNPDTWSRAQQLLGPDQGEYWTRCYVNPFDAKQDLAWAIDRLIENHRINAAIEALENLFYSKAPIDSQQVIRALNALLESSDALAAMDPHAVAQLIKVLQDDPDANQDELLKIEWAFLGIMDGGFGVSPTLLEKTLAESPAFFCDVIRAAFRSSKDDGTGEKPTQAQEAIATNAYRLLREWRTPPGTRQDGAFDEEVLNAWLDEVKAKCVESGHLKIAMQQVGEVLFYSPPDPEGLWLHRSVAAVLNAKDADDIRLGFEVEIINSRGVHFVDPEGKPERELANSYRSQAEDVELAGYHRVAITLRKVAASYDREADQNASKMRLED